MAEEKELTNEEIFGDDGEPKESVPVVKDVEETEPVVEPVEPAKVEDETPTPGEPTLTEVLEKVTTLEKERDGLRGATVAERRKRQAIENQLGQISETIAEIKARRTIPEIPKEPAEPEYISAEVDFDDDDNPIVKTNSAEIKKLIAEEAKRLIADETKTLKDEFQATKEQSANERATEAHRVQVEKIVGQDEAYPQALKDIGEQFQELDKMYTDYATTNGIEGQSPDDAIELIATSEIGKKFQEKFPGIDPEALIELRYAPNQKAYNRKLKKALAMAAKTKTEPKTEVSPVKSALGKPGNLGSLPAAHKSGGKSLDQVAEMDFDDFINLSDKEIDEVDALIQK